MIIFKNKYIFKTTHFPAWSAFNKRIKGARTDVGLWHETYLVKDGQYEAAILI